MKRLIALTFIILTLASCSFVSDSEVQNNNVSTNNSQETITNTGAIRRIKNIRKPRINTWEILQDSGTIIENNVKNTVQNPVTNTWITVKNTEATWNTILDLEKISISTESITSTWLTESDWIESVSEEQVSQLVDLLLEAGK